MSQRNVEKVIGRLITDEGFRRRFALDPFDALFEMTLCGVELSGLELKALASINPSRAGQFADTIDPRIQKVDVQGDLS